MYSAEIATGCPCDPITSPQTCGAAVETGCGCGEDVAEGCGTFAESCMTSAGSGSALDLMIASALFVTPGAVRPRGRRGGLSAARRFGVRMIRAYRRRLAPRLPTRCPYVPTCSRYGEEAVRRYGLVAGARLAVLRIMRCRGDVPRGTVDDVR